MSYGSIVCNISIHTSQQRTFNQMKISKDQSILPPKSRTANKELQLVISKQLPGSGVFVGIKQVSSRFF